MTAATDIYAFGMMGYELLAGQRSVRGPDYREQHLQQTADELSHVSGPVAPLISHCLLKEPGARPSATDVLRRVRVASGPPPTGRTCAFTGRQSCGASAGGGDAAAEF